MENIGVVKEYLGKIKSFREKDELFDEKVGEVVWDFARDDDISTKDIGEILNLALSSLKTDEEIEAAEKVLVAILGEGIFEILDTVETRDREGYGWYCEELRSLG